MRKLERKHEQGNIPSPGFGVPRLVALYRIDTSMSSRHINEELIGSIDFEVETFTQSLHHITSRKERNNCLKKRSRYDDDETQRNLCCIGHPFG